MCSLYLHCAAITTFYIQDFTWCHKKKLKSLGQFWLDLVTDIPRVKSDPISRDSAGSWSAVAAFPAGGFVLL